MVQEVNWLSILQKKQGEKTSHLQAPPLLYLQDLQWESFKVSKE